VPRGDDLLESRRGIGAAQGELGKKGSEVLERDSELQQKESVLLAVR